MTTIKDVARLAGVAPSTVSNYFTDNAPVSAATRSRIAGAVRELGYKPNVAARSLRLNQTQAIGLIATNITNPFFTEIVQAVGYACQQMGYSLLLAESGNDEAREKNLLHNMFKQHIDGLLIIHTGSKGNHLLLDKELPRPVVFVDRGVKGRSSVATDNYAGGKLAAQHLLGLGHKKIGILVGDPHVENVQERLRGFEDELKVHQLLVAPKHIIRGTQSFETGQDVQLLMLSPEQPTAIFATNDIIAVGAWHKLTEMGLRIPEDISLVGYDNIEMSKWTVPSLTTVEQNKRELGRQSVVALVKAIRTNDSSPLTLQIPPSLIVRSSTSALRK